jgi:hypothetical protein
MDEIKYDIMINITKERVKQSKSFIAIILLEFKFLLLFKNPFTQSLIFILVSSNV